MSQAKSDFWPTVKLYAAGIVKMMIVWTLCLIYSCLMAGYVCQKYLWNFRKRPWNTRERPTAPSCLMDPVYGEHKFVTVNVSDSSSRAFSRRMGHS